MPTWQRQRKQSEMNIIEPKPKQNANNETNKTKQKPHIHTPSYIYSLPESHHLPMAPNWNQLKTNQTICVCYFPWILKIWNKKQNSHKIKNKNPNAHTTKTCIQRHHQPKIWTMCVKCAYLQNEITNNESK